MKIELILGEIILTVDGISKILTKQQAITITGFAGTLHHEGSLFCLAAEVIPTITEYDMEIFMDYTREDWEILGQYVAELYEKEQFLVDCRQN